MGKKENLSATDGWQPIETAPRDGEMILAATADGRMMIWKASLLQVAMEPTLSRHLQFPATHWMPLPEPPEVSRGL
jgi:hypothetical protein